jgi:hypothetical protein
MKSGRIVDMTWCASLAYNNEKLFEEQQIKMRKWTTIVRFSKSFYTYYAMYHQQKDSLNKARREWEK